MKIRKVIEIETETYEEQQFILNEFPNAWWNVVDGERVKFLVPISDEKLVEEKVKNWEYYKQI